LLLCKWQLLKKPPQLLNSLTAKILVVEISQLTKRSPELIAADAVAVMAAAVAVMAAAVAIEIVAAIEVVTSANRAGKTNRGNRGKG
jgi:hypothetical protein